MLTRYNKLVRDNIPAVIQKQGKVANFHTAEGDEEYFFRLKEKLQEEMSEFAKDESIEEMADLLEVIDAIIDMKNFDRQELAVVRENKNIEKGKFERRIILESVEEK